LWRIQARAGRGRQRNIKCPCRTRASGVFPRTAGTRPELAALRIARIVPGPYTLRVPPPAPGPCFGQWRGHLSGGPSREAHVPAQQPQARQDARFPHSHAYPRRSGRHPGATRPRPEASLRLIRRVSDRETFEALARARRLRVGAVSVRAVRGDPSGPPRVAYAIGKRTGSAVVRNRIRRRLRAAVALHQAELAPGGAYLVAADRRAMSTPFAELSDQVARSLRQARKDLA